MLTLAFSPVDTWFFRESRPMESLGGTALGNQFPPSPATLLGALRSRLGDLLAINWQTLKQHPEQAPAWWGNSEHPGDLRLSGPWLRIADKDYLPVPALLLKNATAKGFVQLTPGLAVECDLGYVRLPSLPVDCTPGVKPLDGYWIERSKLRHLLNGYALPAESRLYQINDLFIDEYRLGIALDQTRRAAEEGQLYQTRHLRPSNPEHSLAVIVQLGGLPVEEEQRLKTSLQQNPLLRLGGEGRMTHVQLCALPEANPSLRAPAKHEKLLAISLTDLPMSVDEWPLPGFHAVQSADGQRQWQGELDGQPLTLIAMANHKVRRQGGWDLQNHAPRPVRSLLPAGTAFFFAEQPSLATEVRIGNDTALGYGHLILGWWNDKNNQKG